MSPDGCAEPRTVPGKEMVRKASSRLLPFVSVDQSWLLGELTLLHFSGLILGGSQISSPQEEDFSPGGNGRSLKGALSMQGAKKGGSSGQQPLALRTQQVR